MELVEGKLCSEQEKRSVERDKKESVDRAKAGCLKLLFHPVTIMSAVVLYATDKVTDAIDAQTRVLNRDLSSAVVNSSSNRQVQHLRYELDLAHVKQVELLERQLETLRINSENSKKLVQEFREFRNQ